MPERPAALSEQAVTLGVMYLYGYGKDVMERR